MGDNDTMNAKTLAILFLLLCGCEKLRYGNVVEKHFIPEHEEMMPLVIATGKTTMIIPQWWHYENAWTLTVTGVGEKGDTITRTFYVDHLAFDTLNVGSFVCVDGMCDEDTSRHEIQEHAQ